MEGSLGSAPATGAGARAGCPPSPSVLLINCSGIERHGSLAVPLATCALTELTTHDAVQGLRVPVASTVRLVDALPHDDSGFDGLMVMGGPFSVRTVSSDEGVVKSRLAACRCPQPSSNFKRFLFSVELGARRLHPELRAPDPLLPPSGQTGAGHLPRRPAHR